MDSSNKKFSTKKIESLIDEPKEISMGNKVFDIIGMDTRRRSPRTLKRKIRDFFSLPGNSKRESLKKSLKK